MRLSVCRFRPRFFLLFSRSLLASCFFHPLSFCVFSHFLSLNFANFFFLSRCMFFTLSEVYACVCAFVAVRRERRPTFGRPPASRCSVVVITATPLTLSPLGSPSSPPSFFPSPCPLPSATPSSPPNPPPLQSAPHPHPPGSFLEDLLQRLSLRTRTPPPPGIFEAEEGRVKGGRGRKEWGSGKERGEEEWRRREVEKE